MGLEWKGRIISREEWLGKSEGERWRSIVTELCCAGDLWHLDENFGKDSPLFVCSYLKVQIIYKVRGRLV